MALEEARLVRLTSSGLIPEAWIVDRLTARQLRYRLGGLPVRHALLETLEVRRSINRLGPTWTTARWR